MIRSPLALHVLFFIAISAPCAGESPSSMCRLADQALEDASSIRGLRPKGPVPCHVHDKTQVEKFLRETVETRLPANKIRLEELVYKTIGLIPEDFDYVNGIIKMYVNQIGGYYDPEKKHFIMAAWMPAPLQTTVAVHELTHSLQDQHFNLEKIIDPKIENGDMLLAHAAIVEGDATAVMTDYQNRLLGQAMLKDEDSVDSILMQQMLGGAMGAGGESTPEALRTMLIFPYTSGLRFVHHLLKKGGYDEVDKAFRRLPKTSKEILHPEVYFSDKPISREISLSELDVIAGLSGAVYNDTLGEFGISATLAAAMKNRREGVEAAKGWFGDRVGVYKASEAKALLVWKTEWETEEDAVQFEKGYSELVYNRYKKNVSSDRLELTESKAIELKRDSKNVVIRFWVNATDLPAVSAKS